MRLPPSEVTPFPGDDGALVRLPRVLDVYFRFRRTFRRAKPGSEAWLWILPGKRAGLRASSFLAAQEAEVIAEARRRAAAVADAEWSAAGVG